MKQRILTSIIAVAILLPILIFADYPVLPIAIAICSLIAVYEMLACIGLRSAVSVAIPFYLQAAVAPILLRYLGKGAFPILFAVVVFSMLYLFAVLIFSKSAYTLQQLCIAFFSITYILLGFNAILCIHDFEAGGEYLYLLIFIGAWITDIFAYFCGILFGKHKLIPHISPKKTVEGAIGGVFFCILATLLFGFIVERLKQSITANLLIFAVGGLLISVVSQIGDLSMSSIKRTYGVKDYGKIFPGHGGILDRFDSVLAVSVVLLVLTTIFNFFEVL